MRADLDRDVSTAARDRATGRDPAQGGRHPLPSPADFARTLGRLGISPGTTVVAYDDALGASAGLDPAGRRGPALYVGSWSEWCRRPHLPRATG